MPSVSRSGPPGLLVKHRDKCFPVFVDRPHHLGVGLPETEKKHGISQLLQDQKHWKVPDEQGLEEIRLLHDDNPQVLELGHVT